MKSTLLLLVCLLQKQSFTHTVTEHCVWDHATDTDASTADIYRMDEQNGLFVFTQHK